MPDYNLGTARGRIEIDSAGAVAGAATAEAAVNKVGQGWRNSSRSMFKAGAIMSGAAAVVGAGFGMAVKSASDFEKEISAIGAVSGATGPELDQIRAKALQLGKDTQFSASESAVAMEELVKAGIPLKDVLNGAADATVALAAAGGVQMPEAATLAANAMNAFGISAKQMPGVIDSIAGAANASAIDVGQFGQSLQQVGAVAHLAGLSFDDTAVAIAEMGNAGIKGSDAGTSLKTFLQNLIPVTDKEKGLMQELGLISVDTKTAMAKLANEGIHPASTSFTDIISAIEKYNAANGGAKEGTAKAQKQAEEMAMSLGVLKNQFFDAEGKTKSLSQIQQVLADSLKGMTKEQKLATLQTLFGSDAIRAAAVLADNGAAGYDKMATAMGKVSAADVAAKRMDNFAGRIEILKGSLETMAISIGEVLIPILDKLVKGITKVVNWFLSLSPTTQKMIILFIGVAAAVVGIAGFILTLVGAFGILMTAIAPVAAAFGMTSIALAGWIAVIPLIIAAIAVLVYFIVKHWSTIRDFTVQIWNNIKDFIVGIWDSIYGFFKTVFGAIFSVVKVVFNAIKAYYMFVFNVYKTIVVTAFRVILAVFKTVFNIIVGVVRVFVSVVMGIWNAFWNTFGGLVKAVLGLVVALIKLWLTIIAAIFYAGFLALKFVIESIWNGIKFVIETVLNAILAVVRAVWGVIGAPIMKALTLIWSLVVRYFNLYRTIITTVFNAVKSVVVTVWNAVYGVISSIVGRILSVIQGIGRIVAVVAGFFGRVYSAVAEKVGDVVRFVGGIGGKIISAIGDVGKLLYQKGKDIIQGLIDGITSMIHKVTDVIGGITKKIGNFLPGSPVKEGALKVLNRGYAGGQIVNMIADGMRSQIPSLETTLGGITASIAPALTPAITVPTLPRPSQPTAVETKKEVNIEFNAYNPIAETTSDTGARKIRSLAALGVLG